MFEINYTEKTGQFYRVGVIVNSTQVDSRVEEAAEDFAKDYIGTSIASSWNVQTDWGYEIVFENAYMV